MSFRPFAIVAAGVAGIALFSASAHALPIAVSGSGQILDGWNVTPFSNPASPAVVNGPGYKAFLQNNYSPINYPSIGHVPSPGGATGEKFDLEEMYVRQTGASVQFLLVASSSFNILLSGTTYKLGDLMLDFGANGSWDAGMVTQSSNMGLTAGGFYNGITTTGIQNVPGSYYGTPTAAIVGPWAVAGGTMLGQNDIRTGSFSYNAPSMSGPEGTTYFYEYTMNLGNFPGSFPSSLNFQIAWGCGNDQIAGWFNLTPPPVPQVDTAVPEPVSAGLTLSGLGALALAISRRRQRA